MNAMERELRSILRESARGTFEEVEGFPVLEHNDCHTPAGSPNGGQFCSKDAFQGGRPGSTASGPKGTTTPADFQQYFNKAGRGPAARFEQLRSGDPFTLGPSASDPGRTYTKIGGQRYRTPEGGTGHISSATQVFPARKGSVRHKVEPVAGEQRSSPQHVGNYRGMEIHTLGSYTTPYYYVNAPGFGSMEHSPSLRRIKNQINRFKDTGVTPRAHGKAKASERYQKRKRRESDPYPWPQR